MTAGIYGYWDNEKQRVVYIGLSKNIKDRLHEHITKSKYDAQEINRVIQNNPERYEAFILAEGNFTIDELNEMEYQAVEIFKTNRYKYPENEGFNFKDGGDAKEMPEETKKKISESLTGKTRSDEHCQNLSESLTGRTLSEEHKQKLSENHADYSGENHPLWKNYPRIIKQGHNRQGKRRYGIKFNGKVIKQSISINKLEKWFKDNYPNEELIIE